MWVRSARRCWPTSSYRGCSSPLQGVPAAVGSSIPALRLRDIGVRSTICTCRHTWRRKDLYFEKRRILGKRRAHATWCLWMAPATI